ncbi:unnamed protein product [Durusdinium trenchii]|uniref:Peroxin-7 n=1 Tax=Durusdinium trenchii TaxID=1381693 RepID=A0ABP0KP95_9DINO
MASTELRPGRKKALALEERGTRPSAVRQAWWSTGGGRKDTELRSLRIPSTAHRGSLSPSKHSYLPTLQEQAREDRLGRLVDPVGSEAFLGRAAFGVGSEKQGRAVFQHVGETLSGLRPVAISAQKLVNESLALEAEKKGGGHLPEAQVLTDLSADVLENVKAEFVENGGALNGEDFVRAMLRPWDGVDADGWAGADLFSHMDVHGESSVTWEDVSNYFIEQGMSGGDEFTVDSIKTYEVSQVKDVSKHETPVEKLVYLESIDSLVCLSRGSRQFRLYDPKRCVLKDTVHGHRGTVINCCYVDAWSQIATTAADMTICFWDSHLQLRNRLAAKDVQLCLQWDSLSRSLFSGAIDGTLSRWDPWPVFWALLPWIRIATRQYDRRHRYRGAKRPGWVESRGDQ